MQGWDMGEETMMAEQPQNPERPCTWCHKPTRLLWSYDMDLPALPFCDKVCALQWQLDPKTKETTDDQAD